ncbi:hypothetical protein MKEN_01353800 [Mycena kentingensis (nom. inval.)]|nr:hypothetical protein MKEN_01353800 [Mycena kentingensis (nom. inval.)]
MSRRESRVSMGARQNDALVEFENFKKKFLLANKHITKPWLEHDSRSVADQRPGLATLPTAFLSLNSTLSMKIEELNTEISTLYSENLRLRASEITLTTELKREREKSRRILSDAESVAHALTSQLATLRDTYNVPLTASPTPTPPRRTTPSPRNSAYNNNPTVNRLSREPQVPNINEDEEEPEDAPRKAKKKARLSASRLPLPARSSTPPTEVPPLAFSDPTPTPLPLDFSTLVLPTKKRRQSGLLLDLGTVDLDALEVDDGGASARENEMERENERLKEKERKRALREAAGMQVKPKAKLKDVTNANSPRTTKIEHDLPSRAFLVPAPPSPPPAEPQPLPVPPMPTPVVSAGSSSSLDRDNAAGVGALSEAEGGRERRVRKSVNYAEPKLNTKMRKPPGSEPTTTTTKRSRSSTSSVPVSTRRPSPPLPGHGRAPPAEEEVVDVEEDGDGEDSDAWADGGVRPAGMGWGAC